MYYIMKIVDNNHEYFGLFSKTNESFVLPFERDYKTIYEKAKDYRERLKEKGIEILDHEFIIDKTSGEMTFAEAQILNESSDFSIDLKESLRGDNLNMR